MEEQTKRYYILGSEWLYYKLYMGSQTSEEFLISEVLPMADELIKQKIIDKWFFINYNDPGRHIRLRFHLTDRQQNLNTVVQLVHDAVSPLISDRLVTDVQTDTYKREIERYRSNTIEEFETLFFLNSRLVVKILEYGDGDPNKRWLFALKAIDVFLSDWELGMEEKSKFCGMVEGSFSSEMGSTKAANQYLSEKFRINRNDIIKVINDEDNFIDGLLLEHSKESKPIIQAVLKKNGNDQESKFDLLESYVHMHCNRSFSSRQRVNEWVLYLFLHKHYRSEIAKNKK